MASDNKKVLGPEMHDTRLRNQFLKTGKFGNAEVVKALSELPDDSEWATWVPLEKIFKEDEEETDLPNEQVLQ